MPRTTVVSAPRAPSLAVIGVVVLAVVGALALAPAAMRAASAAVQITDGAFGPATLTVNVGDTVTWTNVDDRPHTASAEGGVFDSGNLEPGQSFSHTFTAPGTYTYRCEYHPEMVATIVVDAAPAAPAAASAAAPPSATAAPVSGTAAGAHGTGHQPDTALPAVGQDQLPIAQVLMGLGVVALAFGIVPSIPFRPRGRALAASAAARSTGGWRR